MSETNNKIDEIEQIQLEAAHGGDNSGDIRNGEHIRQTRRRTPLRPTSSTIRDARTSLEPIHPPNTRRHILHMSRSSVVSINFITIHDPVLDHNTSSVRGYIRDNPVHIEEVVGSDIGDDGCGWEFRVGFDPIVVFHEFEVYDGGRDMDDGSDDSVLYVAGWSGAFSAVGEYVL